MSDERKVWRWWFPAYVHTILFLAHWLGVRVSNKSIEWVVKRGMLDVRGRGLTRPFTGDTNRETTSQTSRKQPCKRFLGFLLRTDVPRWPGRLRQQHKNAEM